MEERRGGVGVIAEDAEGRVLGAAQSVLHGVRDPEVIETVAAIRAMEFAHHMGFTNVLIEGEALYIIKLINQADQDLSGIGNLIEEAKTATRKFLLCRTHHTKKEGNSVAHSLAKLTLLLEEDLFWIEECPECF